MSDENGLPCYFCGQPSTSREHVPPKILFRGFDCDSITVPSCAVHNSQKSSLDQAIASALAQPLYQAVQNKQYPDPLHPDILKAIQIISSAFERVKRKTSLGSLIDDPPPELVGLPDVSLLDESVDIEMWIRQLTAALIYHGVGFYDSSILWDQIEVWSPDYIVSQRKYAIVDRIIEEYAEMRAFLKGVTWYPGWTAHPRPYPYTIYHCEIIFDFKRSPLLFLKHQFYMEQAWYTWFVSSPRMMEILDRKMRP